MRHTHQAGAGTRRFAAAAAVTGVLALAGCAGSGATAADDDAGSGSGAGGATRSFEHDGGSTVVPEDPQRVVVTYDGPRLDVALMCGVHVVGGGHSQVIPGGFPEWNDPEQVRGIADIGWAEFDLEAVTALDPDLIVTQPEVDVNETLAEIAPTVSLDLNGNEWTSVGDWKDAHRRLGELYACEDDVEAEITRVERRLAALRERIEEQDLRVSVVRGGTDGLSVYSNRLYSALLGELGVEQPPAERVAGGVDFADFSPERIPELDGDVVLVRGLDEAGDGEATPRQYYDDVVAANPLWARLAAVEAGQAHVVSGAEWNSTGGFEAADRIIDDLEEVLPDADPGVYGG